MVDLCGLILTQLRKFYIEFARHLGSTKALDGWSTVRLDYPGLLRAGEQKWTTRQGLKFRCGIDK